MVNGRGLLTPQQPPLDPDWWKRLRHFAGPKSETERAATLVLLSPAWKRLQPFAGPKSEEERSAALGLLAPASQFAGPKSEAERAAAWELARANALRSMYGRR